MFLADQKNDLNCDYLSLRNRVYLGASRIVLGYDHIIELPGSGAKHKCDASSHLTVCLAHVVSSAGPFRECISSLPVRFVRWWFSVHIGMR